MTSGDVSWRQVVVEFSVRRGPNSAAAGEVFRPHQAFVRAVHVGTGAAATFRSKVTLLPGTPPNPLMPWYLVHGCNRPVCHKVWKPHQEEPPFPRLSWGYPKPYP